MTDVDSTRQAELRPQAQRRVPPDRGIVLLDAKGRIGPRIWALYGRVDRPVVLKDDYYLDNSLNPFYRDAQGHAFLLLPFVEPDAADRYEIADAAYRRAVALGITESPEIFFTCVYQFQLPEYRCVNIHADTAEEKLPESKYLQLMVFEKLRLGYPSGALRFVVEVGKKIMPVTVQREQTTIEPSTNLLFAVNSLVLHYGYDTDRLQAAWDMQSLC